MAAEPFVLSFVSPETGCAAHQMRFFAEKADLAAFLNDGGGIEGRRFTLDTDELRGLSARFGLALPQGETTALLSRPHALDSLPYLVHTHYELPLMLEGRKPFAAFRDITFDGEPAFGELRALFRPHVEAGRIVEALSCERQVFPTAGGGWKEAWDTQLFYALPGEDWRIAAWTTLMRERGGRGHDEDTREEGRLLGYTPQECDRFLEHLKRRRLAEAHQEP